MRNYAVELRQLAYTLPLGVGEHDLLQLSDRMRAAADQLVRKGRNRSAAFEADLPAHEPQVDGADQDQHAHVEPPGARAWRQCESLGVSGRAPAWSGRRWTPTRRIPSAPGGQAI
ncbi:hypothetical protein I549_3300 [Mycobacterium avium subsp. avium 2285 (R)]|nr:hypothetical protein I549_3300 [Mycobacterium avium subsp. avium 2285 (R)]